MSPQNESLFVPHEEVPPSLRIPFRYYLLAPPPDCLPVAAPVPRKAIPAHQTLEPYRFQSQDQSDRQIWDRRIREQGDHQIPEYPEGQMPEHPDRQILGQEMPVQEIGEHQMLVQQVREPKEPEPSKPLPNQRLQNHPLQRRKPPFWMGLAPH